MTVVLTLLLTAVLLAARLQRSSLVASATTAAAEEVARDGPGTVAARREAAARRLRSVLGPEARIRWADEDDGVRLTVTVPAPPVPGLSGTIRREAVVRWERLQ